MGTNSRAPMIAMIVVVTVTSALGLWQKSSCYDMGWDRAGRQQPTTTSSPTPVTPTSRCSTASAASSSATSPTSTPAELPVLEYPVLTGVVMYVIATLTRLFGSSDPMADSVRFFAFNVVLLWGLALVVGWSLIRARAGRPLGRHAVRRQRPRWCSRPRSTGTSSSSR